jgi:hypothetical protein
MRLRCGRNLPQERHRPIWKNCRYSCNTALTTVVKGRIVDNAAVFLQPLLRSPYIMFNSAAGDGRLVVSSAIQGLQARRNYGDEW